jgi:hypothetical protein
MRSPLSPSLAGALLCLLHSSLIGQTPDSEVVQALTTGQQLLMDAHRPKEALLYLKFVTEHGNRERRQQAASTLYTGATFLLQEPQDLIAAVDLLREATRAADPSDSIAPAAHYLLGMALLYQVPDLPIPEAEASCTYARDKEALLEESEHAFRSSGSFDPEGVSEHLAIIRKYRPRIRSMLKAFCWNIPVSANRAQLRLLPSAALHFGSPVRRCLRSPPSADAVAMDLPTLPRAPALSK